MVLPWYFLYVCCYLESKTRKKELLSSKFSLVCAILLVVGFYLTFFFPANIVLGSGSLLGRILLLPSTRHNGQKKKIYSPSLSPLQVWSNNCVDSFINVCHLILSCSFYLIKMMNCVFLLVFLALYIMICEMVTTSSSLWKDWKFLKLCSTLLSELLLVLEIIEFKGIPWMLYLELYGFFSPFIIISVILSVNLRTVSLFNWLSVIRNFVDFRKKDWEIYSKDWKYPLMVLLRSIK